MNDIQPKLNELREKHKDNKEAQAKAMMELYKEHKINPFASCLPLLLQLPILIGLYQVFRVALNPAMNMTSVERLYSLMCRGPRALARIFLRLWICRNPALLLAVIAGLAQFWQSKLMMPKTAGQDATMKAMQMQTTYVLPVISMIIAMKLPAGLPLYWIVTTLFAVGQQYYINEEPN